MTGLARGPFPFLQQPEDVDHERQEAPAGGGQANAPPRPLGELDAEVADKLLAKIDEIAEIFWETKKA